MPYDQSWRISNLLLEVRDLRAQLRLYKSGEAFTRLKEMHRKELASKDRQIRALRDELAKAHADIVDMRNKWLEVYEDVRKESDRAVKEKEGERRRMEERMWEAVRERDEALEKLKEERGLRYEAQTQALEKQEKIEELNSRLNKDYTNSSKPSSQCPNRKKIPNGREKTDRKKGAQEGHEHHARKKAVPTAAPVEIPPPGEYLDTGKYRPTGRMIHKQLVRLRILPEVTDFVTPEFRNVLTGQRVHARFPYGLKEDVTYDGTVKAMVHLLNNECCVSMEKTKFFLRDITGGVVDPSIGFINSLSREFSEKTAGERNDIFLKLLASETMHADFTFGRMNGKQTAVMICASGDSVLYQGREKKGHEGVKGSPLELYGGIVISDHEAALRCHGKSHQECMVHVLRYLKSSMENEKNRTWSGAMHALIREMIHYRNSISSPEEMDARVTGGFVERFDAILLKAEEEYGYEPPPEWFRDGYNLYRRMKENKGDYLLFLRNPAVEPSNNKAERYARKFKRKAAQMMCFRSQEGVNLFCDGLTILESLKARNENLFHAVAERFGLITMP